MPPSLPADRALALACSIRTLRHLWLHIRCCGSATIPFRIVNRAGTLADYVMALRCKQCCSATRRMSGWRHDGWPVAAPVVDSLADAWRQGDMSPRVTNG